MEIFRVVLHPTLCLVQAPGCADEPVQLTNNTAADSYPSWSPDGQQIVFQSLRDGDSEIYVMDAAGVNQTRLTYIGRHNWFPAWSPDGALIVYESERQGNRDLYLIDLADSEPSSILLTDSPAIDSAPRWSPDGRHIAFVSSRTGNEEIFILTLDSSDDYSLFNLTNHLANDRNPMWDPTGKRITFESYEDGRFELVIINIDGTARQQLTHDDQLGHQFSWQP